MTIYDCNIMITFPTLLSIFLLNLLKGNVNNMHNHFSLTSLRKSVPSIVKTVNFKP